MFAWTEISRSWQTSSAFLQVPPLYELERWLKGFFRIPWKAVKKFLKKYIRSKKELLNGSSHWMKTSAWSRSLTKASWKLDLIFFWSMVDVNMMSQLGSRMKWKELLALGFGLKPISPGFVTCHLASLGNSVSSNVPLRDGISFLNRPVSSSTSFFSVGALQRAKKTVYNFTTLEVWKKGNSVDKHLRSTSIHRFKDPATRVTSVHWEQDYCSTLSFQISTLSHFCDCLHLKQWNRREDGCSDVGNSASWHLLTFFLAF